VTGETPGAARTVVVSRDSRVLALAAARGAHPVEEPGDRGLNAALHAARAAAVQHGAEALLVVPTDLPLLCAADIDALAGQIESRRPMMLIAPDRAGTGTNALLLAPPGALDFAFGPDSLAAHLAAARDAGLASSVVHLGNLSFDVDTPDDYRRLCEIEAEEGA
jgi:2-phospho-L-lactate guanylyltransferase